MPFEIGVLEIAAITVVGVVAFAMLNKQLAGYRWMIAFWGCLTVASVVSPADMFTTLLLTPAFLGVHYAGTLRSSLSQETH